MTPYDHLNAIANSVHDLACEKGWHQQPAHLRYGEFCANLHAEVSELWEAYRREELDVWCGKGDFDSEDSLTCEEEELADIVIRALDMAVANAIDIGRAVRLKHALNTGRPWRHGGKIA